MNGKPCISVVTSNFTHAWATVAFLDYEVDDTLHLTIFDGIVWIELQLIFVDTDPVIVGSW